MGIELPAQLQDIATATGVSWPEADEDAMWEQARSWRQAAAELTTLAGDADAEAEQALAALSGPVADAARSRWAQVGDADTGVLAEAARGATGAADRLDHAAERVADAKVEIVRQLVETARTRDAALAAADAGHPAALLGVDTVVRGAASDLGVVTSELAESVAGGVAAPGTGQDDRGAVDSVADPVVNTVDDLATPGAPEVVVDAVESLQAAEPANPVAPPDSEIPVDPMDPMGPLERVHPVESVPVPDVAEVVREPDNPDTGPIVSPHAPTPPSGQPLPGGPGPAVEAPTPPSGTAFAGPGQTHLSGFGGPPPAPPPGPSPGWGGYAPPQYPAAPPAPPQYGAGPPPAPGPAYPAGPVPPAPPVPGRPVAGPWQAPHPPAVPPPGVQPAPQPGAQPGPPPGLQPGPVRPPAPPPPAAPPPPSAPPAPQPAQPAAPQAPQPGAAAVAVGAPRRERESVAALFMVHMFPIGHLPVAADRPARQLPGPEVDDGRVLPCYPPHDHPRSPEIDPEHALAMLRGGGRHPAPPPVTVLPCPPEESAPPDALGELSELEWNRRYLVREGPRPEYAWPPPERFPEGCHEPGEAVCLAEGTLLDRFGTAHGRVFAADGTPFAHRCLPPAHRESGYRRYRVLRELPVWQAVSAPWFGQPGGGTRYRAMYSAAELVVLGYLADITFEERA
ncbi:DUF4237 domain-containing protein [Saccharomonospora piscinae]|uniref:TNT domain-containing protein n=1 Tax=Saccharomonospora piscinae TaxID=687388 RepID=UPI001106FC41|nr:TNT domain-containing protein [Saccharomonospora piscinae]TLW89610.1 DUF4237 domain-containing protein [Saccharomonospora piscinae]